MVNQKRFPNGLIRWLLLIGLVLFFGLILWGYSRGTFYSVAPLQTSIKQFSNYAVLCFILLQIVQMVIPILPGRVSSVTRMLMFDSLQGLLYSYFGLIIGEFIGFLLIRYHRCSFVRIILPPNKYKKLEEILDKSEHNIKKLLVFTVLIPFALDNTVCLVVGITDISLEEFMKIVLLLEFWSVATYSYLMLYLFRLSGKL